MSKLKMIVAALLVAAFAGGAEAQFNKAQKGGGKKVGAGSDADLRAEIARLRADLNAAMREINALKIAIAGGKAVPDQDLLYRGRPASSWLEQLKDASPAFRADALDAIVALAPKNDKLVPALLESLREEPVNSVATKAVKGLGKVGPSVLPALIEIAKDKTLDYPKLPRRRAIEAIGWLGPKAKPAVPVLAQVLGESKDVGTCRTTVTALRLIGSGATEAIPALVNKLEFCLEDVRTNPKSAFFENDRPLFGPGGAGGRQSFPHLIVDAMAWIDPNLREELPERAREILFSQRRDRDRDALEGDWRKAVDVLKKRYAVKK